MLIRKSVILLNWRAECSVIRSYVQLLHSCLFDVYWLGSFAVPCRSLICSGYSPIVPGATLLLHDLLVLPWQSTYTLGLALPLWPPQMAHSMCSSRIVRRIMTNAGARKPRPERSMAWTAFRSSRSPVALNGIATIPLAERDHDWRMVNVFRDYRLLKDWDIMIGRERVPINNVFHLSIG